MRVDASPDGGGVRSRHCHMGSQIFMLKTYLAFNITLEVILCQFINYGAKYNVFMKQIN